MLDDDQKRQEILNSLIEKRNDNPNNDDAFFNSLDKVERMLLTNIHFGLCKVSKEHKKLLTMK